MLLALRRRLLEERGELRHTVAEPLEPHGIHEADSASDEFDPELALSKLSSDSGALREVDDVLRRLESGAYGVCEATGRLIPAARLKAIPWARFTREAQEKLEKDKPPTVFHVPPQPRRVVADTSKGRS